MSTKEGISRVIVCIRCRPLLLQEKISKSCVKFEGNSKLLISDKSFVFDQIFDGNTRQSVVYDEAVKNLVEGSLKGFNGTIFAYGQTGSGKTYSMVGASVLRSDADDDEIGIIPRAIRDLFQRAKDAEQNGSVVNFRVSFIEIYNEEFKDLLHPEILSREIMIREDKDGRIFFTGARDESANTIQQAFAYLDKGNISRTTAETLMNATSSRSHAIFTVSIEVFTPSTETSSNETEGQHMVVGGEYIHSKLHIVDLAGSERAKRTGAGGIRLKESVGINQGLLSLGKVIRALTAQTPSGSTAHVPYRESKLTRFLQDSLGGNSRTVMLACISPAEINIHETLNTLQYAYRARSVQNKVVANIAIAPPIIVDSSDNDVENNIIGILRAQIQKMHLEINGLKQDQIMSGPSHDKKLSARVGNDDSMVSYQKCLSSLLHVKDELRSEVMKIGDNASSNTCGIAWNLVTICRRLMNQLQDTLKQLHDLNLNHPDNHLRLSSSKLWADSIAIDDYHRLEQELSECKEDLKRDEEIFAEKVKELKNYRKLLRQVERERDDLKSIIDDLKQAKHQLSGYSPSKAAGGDDDMELSIAIAATEPDISQLMEDLETISREKEMLLADKHRSEQHYHDAISSVNTQKIEYERIQHELEARLHTLQDQIESKQHQMQDLKESHYHAHELASMHQERVAGLEQESTSLKHQLELLSQSSQLSAKEVANEKARRVEYEHQLRAVQEELEELRQESASKEINSSRMNRSVGPSRPSTSQRQVDSVAEAKHHHHSSSYDGKLSSDDEMKLHSNIEAISSLRDEYNRLSAQHHDQQVKHDMHIHDIMSQLDDYRSRDAAFQHQIESLEYKNMNLKSRLERWAEAKGFPLDQSLSSSMQSIITTANRKQTHNHHNISSSSSSLKSIQHIKSKIYHLVNVKLSFLDCVSIYRQLDECDIDRKELNNELKPIIQQQQENESHIKKQLKEVKRKLKVILTNIQEARSQANLPVASNTQLHDLLRDAKSYQEHYDELSGRLNSRQLLDNVTMNRMVEIQEEMEAVESEAHLHKQSLQQESDRLYVHLSNMNLTSEHQDRLLDIASHVARSSYNQTRDDHILEIKEVDDFFRETIQDESYNDIISEMMITSVNAMTSHQLDQNIISNLRIDLDKKQEEHEELVSSLKYTRAELIKKQDDARIEADEKIELLLQQLRIAEDRVNHMLASNNNMSSSSMISSSRPGTAEHRYRGNGVNSSSKYELQSSSRHIQPSPVRTSRSFERMISDQQLIDASHPDPINPRQSIGNSNHHHDHHNPMNRSGIASYDRDESSVSMDGHVSAQIHQEVIRRWQTEKDRRILLETRTAELSRELRQLKARVYSSDQE